MIKFRNSGCDMATQVGIMRALYAEYNDKYFGLDEFAKVAVNNNLLTAYGYTGDMAMSLSNVEDESRNSTKMNAKMYAEIFRHLGWLSSYQEKSAYPLIVTELGRYVATSSNPVRLYEQCLLGINNPQEIISGVKYDEHVRFFVCALRTLSELDGVMHKHELCMGPMSVNDNIVIEYNSMVQRLRDVRGDHSRLMAEWAKLCSSLNMKSSSVDNQTRFPVAALKTCGWVEQVQDDTIFQPKKLRCIKLTDRGREILSQVEECKDLRLDEFKTYDKQTQDALIRFGFYRMLGRANYDLSPVENKIRKDRETVDSVTEGRDLLFSPFQTLRWRRVNEALGLDTPSYVQAVSSSIDAAQRGSGETTRLEVTKKTLVGESNSPIACNLKSQICMLRNMGKSEVEIVDTLFQDERRSNQDRFYPLVGAMFNMLGFDCRVSRQGDNGSRMDAIIIGPGNAVPIEIESPGEEEYISIKAVKQAAENKIILLSRKQYPTSVSATSLVVGYHAPNERAEVSSLIDAFKNAYGINVGVISYDVLLKLVVRAVIDGHTIKPDQLESIKGFADVTSE